jgi:hypothetical protein
MKRRCLGRDGKLFSTRNLRVECTNALSKDTLLIFQCDPDKRIFLLTILLAPEMHHQSQMTVVVPVLRFARPPLGNWFRYYY